MCFILIIIEHFRLSGLIKKYRRLIKGLSKDNNVEDLMFSYSDELIEIKNLIEGKIENRIANLERNLPYCLKNIGLVTYNAFKNVSNNMSFSLAALDDRKDGFVLTGIYTRENSYVYIKEILSGKPSKELSAEEQDALSKALSYNK